MAHKKRINLEEPGERAPDPEAEGPEASTEGWTRWVRATYSKYWFAVLCLFVDVMVTLETIRMLEGSGLQILSLMLLASAVIIEYVLFRRLWPKEGLEPG